jgi:beta-1,4-mannosyltransferase
MFYTVLRILHYSPVWTVHNVVPQISQTSNDEYLMQILSRTARAKIVHSSYVIGDMKTHRLDTSAVTVIPHGNYIGVYPENTTPHEARSRLNLGSDDIVVLFLGSVSAYKGVDKLLAAMNDITEPHVRLVIAGRCSDASLRSQIMDAAKNGRIDFYEGHVPDDQIDSYFKASNVVCLPFTTITTSGSTILALSLGKPIIVPRMGALCDLPEDIGYFYDPNEEGGLTKALKKALADPTGLSHRGANAKKYADSVSWDVVASKTYAVYQAVLDEESPMSS